METNTSIDGRVRKRDKEAIDYIRKLRPGSIETEEQEAAIDEYERIHLAIL